MYEIHPFPTVGFYLCWNLEPLFIALLRLIYTGRWVYIGISSRGFTARFVLVWKILEMVIKWQSMDKLQLTPRGASL